MKKKVVSILLSCAMAATMFAGCGATEKVDTTTDTKEDTSEKADSDTSSTDTKTDTADGGADISGSLVIWDHTDQFAEPLKAVIAEFNKKYPDVTVETEIKTSDQYYNLLQTAMQAGETPDLFWTNGTATTQYESYVKQGLCMDISDKVDFSLYDDTQAMGIVTVDGKVYATPTAEVGGRCVYYNKDIFKELGLEVPKTFDEFEALLVKIAETDYTPIAFSASDPWEVLFQFEPVLSAMSSDFLEEYATKGHVAVNDERVVAAYNKMLDWADKGYYGTGYLGADGSGTVLAFSTGKAAMYIDGTWNIATIDENNPDLNYGAFQIPTPDGVVPFVGTSSCGYSVSADTENPDAALAFENFFASLEGQQIWISALNSIPCTTKITSESSVVNDIAKFDKQVESYYSILGYEADPDSDESPTNVWEQDQTKVFSRDLTPQEFVDELAELTK